MQRVYRMIAWKDIWGCGALLLDSVWGHSPATRNVYLTQMFRLSCLLSIKGVVDEIVVQRANAQMSVQATLELKHTK